MIAVDGRLKDGDRAFAWVSPVPLKAGRRPEEREFGFARTRRGGFMLLSVPGCHTLYTKELADSWFGNVRKA